MKEECKLCSVGGWGGGAQTTDFSISSLMRPTVPHSAHMDPRQDAVLLSAYLLKLGDYSLYTLHNYYANLGEYRALWAFFLPSGFDSACDPLNIDQDVSTAIADKDNYVAEIILHLETKHDNNVGKPLTRTNRMQVGV